MFSRIGVGTDGSKTAEIALDHALDLAERYGAELVIISAYKPIDEARIKREKRDAPVDQQWSINPMRDVEALLEEAVDAAKERGVPAVTVAADGDPADVLCRFAEEQEVDVLVIGNQGMQRRVLGSVPNSVTHKAPCSVLLVKTV